MFELKPDYEKTLDRYRAYWACSVLDRPTVDIRLPKPGASPFPKKTYANWDDSWLDIDYRIEKTAYEMENTLFLGDSLPLVFPNLGPEIYSAWCGCGYRFTEDSTWSEPAIRDWEEDAGKVRLDMNHPLFKTLERFTDGLLARGEGRFIPGLTDFHPGGDHLAALRDPADFAMDLLENPEHVKAELTASTDEYFAAYNHFYDRLKAGAGKDAPISSWMGSLCGDGRFYIPSNDFSCMISNDMFREFFLPGIRQECRFYDQSVYHLDGPGALRHLDDLLAIPELNAIQWVFGAGNEGYARWVDVYRRIQKAGKGNVLYVDKSELPLVYETLRPEGIHFGYIGGISDQETAEAVIRSITAWK